MPPQGFPELATLLMFVSENADRTSGICWLPATECLDSLEAVSIVNVAGWRESLEVLDLNTVRVKDWCALAELIEGLRLFNKIAQLE